MSIFIKKPPSTQPMLLAPPTPKEIKVIQSLLDQCYFWMDNQEPELASKMFELMAQKSKEFSEKITIKTTPWQKKQEN